MTKDRAEGINAGIRRAKYRARGYRNRQRFRDAIYCHFGGLDATHTVSHEDPYLHECLKSQIS